jgi:hypothetical protein
MAQRLPLFRFAATAAALAALAGCADAGVATGPETAHEVSVAVTVPGLCIVASCTAPVGGPNALGLIEITNSGSADAFLVACGSTVAIGEQVFRNGTWAIVGPAVLCALPSTPIRLAAGQTMRFNDYFAPGTRRVGVGVTADGTLATQESAVSGSFRVF